MGRLLEVEDLCVHFHTFAGTAKVLDGVSFRLDEGETLGVVGESGCGKSVTAQAIIGLLPRPPAEVVRGSIRFGGEDLLRKTEAEMRALRGTRISMVFQDPMTYLNPVFSIGEQLTDVILAHRTPGSPGALGLATRRWNRTETAEARRTAVDLLRQVNIPDPGERLRQYPHEFSGGMRQRVLLAMALAVSIQAQILRLLKRYQRENEMAMIFVSHDLGTVAGIADDIAVMYAGRIVEYGPVGQVLNAPRMPYTEALLRSIPRLDAPSHGRLDAIRGRPPLLTALPEGCAFQARCPYAQPRCATERPWLSGAPHAFACWFPCSAAYARESLA